MALPEGLTPKTVTVGVPTKFNGQPATGSATLSAPKNLVHTPTGTPLFSGQVTKRFSGLAEVEFTDLVATDADGLNRVDWTYTLEVRVNGAVEQPEPIVFILPDAGPDTVDADLMVEVPSSAGTPVSVSAVTSVAGFAGEVTLEELEGVLNLGGIDSGSFTVDGAPPSGGVLDIDSDAVTATDVGAVPVTLVDAKGDLLVATAADTLARVAVGTNGQVLTADSTLTPGVKWATPSAGSGDGDTWLGYAASNLSASTSNTVITAGRIWFARVTRGSKTGATKVGVQIATSSGNIMVGVYSPTGSGISALPGALKGSSIVTACPAAGYQEITLQAATDIAAGDYLALWCDNTTASFAYIGNNAATHKAVACYNDAGTGITALPAGPISAGSINGFSRHYTLTGV